MSGANVEVALLQEHSHHPTDSLSLYASAQHVPSQIQHDKSKKQKFHDFWRNHDALTDFVAGCVGGVSSTVLGHPFDTVKTLMQMQNTSKSSGNAKLSATGVVKDLWQSQGAHGFYRGITSPLAGVAFMNAVIFGGHAKCLNFVTSRGIFPSSEPEKYPSYTQIALAGAGTGFLQCSVCVPMDLCKIRAQTSSTTAFGFAKRVLSRHGVQGLYRGLFSSIYRDVPGYAAYFLSYEWSLDKLTNDMRLRGELEVPTWALLTAGAIGGVVGWFVSFPMDVVKSQLQAGKHVDPLSSQASFWRPGETLNVCKKIYKQNGIRGFFSGLSPTLIRAIPVNAVTFYAVDYTRRKLQGDL